MNKWSLYGLALALWAAGCVLPSYYESQFLPPLEKRLKVDVVLDVLGESRTVLARFMFLKADVYHHVMEKQGIANTQETELMPLLRLSTYLDPRLDESYDLMSYDLVAGFKDLKQALELLDEGLIYSPKSFPLNFRKAFLAYENKDYEVSAQAARTALLGARNEFDTLNSLRLAYHSAVKLKQWDEAARVLELWREVQPDDPTVAAETRALAEKRDTTLER